MLLKFFGQFSELEKISSVKTSQKKFQFLNMEYRSFNCKKNPVNNETHLLPY